MIRNAIVATAMLTLDMLASDPSGRMYAHHRPRPELTYCETPKPKGKRAKRRAEGKNKSKVR